MDGIRGVATVSMFGLFSDCGFGCALSGCGDEPVVRDVDGCGEEVVHGRCCSRTCGPSDVDGRGGAGRCGFDEIRGLVGAGTVSVLEGFVSGATEWMCPAIGMGMLPEVKCNM